jgi:hypothetical protein
MTTSQAGSPSSTTSRQKNKSEKEANKKKVDVHLLATDAQVFFGVVFFATPLQCLLQHHFSKVFYNTASTPLLQHCFNMPMQHYLLQQHFNIAFVAPSSTTLFLLLSDGEI